MGRPPFEPSDQQRQQVQTLAGAGNESDVIAAVIGISEPTLRKYFWPELVQGRLLGRAANTQRLIASARKGNVTAMIWLDKTRYGVREPDAAGKKQIVRDLAETADAGTRWSGLLQ